MFETVTDNIIFQLGLGTYLVGWIVTFVALFGMFFSTAVENDYEGKPFHPVYKNLAIISVVISHVGIFASILVGMNSNL